MVEVLDLHSARALHITGTVMGLPVKDKGIGIVDENRLLSRKGSCTALESDWKICSQIWVIAGRIYITPENAQLAWQQFVLECKANGENIPPMRELQGYVLSGIVDVHAHVGMNELGKPASQAQTYLQIAAHLQAGVTVVRDLGIPGSTAWIDNLEEAIWWPKIIRCGRHIARPKRYLPNLAVELDDPAHLVAEVNRQVNQGYRWVKLVGDWIDRSAGSAADLAPLWPKTVLKEAVAVAHAQGARVAVHAFSQSVVPDLLLAGVDNIEHACSLNDEQLEECKRQKIALTPTALQTENFASIANRAHKYPVYQAHMRKIYAQRGEQIARIFDSGAPVLLGTDAGTSIMHGRLAAEAAACVAAGVPASQVLAAASYASRAFLGLPGLVDGELADLVLYDQDPSKNIQVLENPQMVVLARV